jgi:hypothetical protein
MHQPLWGYKVEEKLHLGLLEQIRLNTTDLNYGLHRIAIVIYAGVFKLSLQWNLTVEWHTYIPDFSAIKMQANSTTLQCCLVCVLWPKTIFH